MPFGRSSVFNHLLFWVGIYVFYTFSVADRELFRQFAETTFFRLPLLMAAAYSLNYWLVPKYLEQKKYCYFWLYLLATLLILTFINRVIGYLYLDKYCSEALPFLAFEDFPYHMLSFHFPALMMYFYMSNQTKHKERQRLSELQKDKVVTELKYLKAQLNPHFLFNTLNNLYSFVITNSPKAGDMILQLSEILDYILYRSQNTLVMLSEEIKTIENYIALQEIRYGNNLTISFSKELNNERVEICPLLFLSLVENAFKHGATSSVSNPKIDINLKQSGATLLLKIWNTNAVKQVGDDIKLNSGKSEKRIGLSNIQQQLNLIYPQRHEIKIQNNEASFELELTIKTI
jgi:sensor histidine kinase YesM